MDGEDFNSYFYLGRPTGPGCHQYPVEVSAGSRDTSLTSELAVVSEEQPLLPPRPPFVKEEARYTHTDHHQEEKQGSSVRSKKQQQHRTPTIQAVESYAPAMDTESAPPTPRITFPPRVSSLNNRTPVPKLSTKPLPKAESHDDIPSISPAAGYPPSLDGSAGSGDAVPTPAAAPAAARLENAGFNFAAMETRPLQSRSQSLRQTQENPRRKVAFAEADESIEQPATNFDDMPYVIDADNRPGREPDVFRPSSREALLRPETMDRETGVHDGESRRKRAWKAVKEKLVRKHPDRK